MLRRRYFRRRAHRWRLAVLLPAAFAAFLWAAGFVFFIATLPRGGDGDVPRVDAIVVLTGGSMRLEAGLALFAAQKADKLFISGVHRSVDVAQLLHLSRQTPQAVDCCLVLGYAADDTSGNARETMDWMNKENYRSMLLVTANYHMPRSLLEMRSVLPATDIVPYPVNPPHVALDEWWRRPGTAALLAGEYSKLLLAWLRIQAETAAAQVAALVN